MCFLAITFSSGLGLILYFIISFLTESDNKNTDIDFDDETPIKSKVNTILKRYSKRKNNFLLSADSKDNFIELFEDKIVINQSAEREYINEINLSKIYRKAYKKLKKDNKVKSKKDFLVKIGYKTTEIPLDKVKHVDLNNNLLKITLDSNKEININFKYKNKDNFQKIYNNLKNKGLNKPKEIEEFKAECKVCGNIYYFDYKDKLNQKINKYKELSNLATGSTFIPKKDMDIKRCPECGSRAVEIEKVIHVMD